MFFCLQLSGYNDLSREEALPGKIIDPGELLCNLKAGNLQLMHQFLRIGVTAQCDGDLVIGNLIDGFSGCLIQAGIGLRLIEDIDILHSLCEEFKSIL